MLLSQYLFNHVNDKRIFDLVKAFDSLLLHFVQNHLMRKQTIKVKRMEGGKILRLFLYICFTKPFECIYNMNFQIRNEN